MPHAAPSFSYKVLYICRYCSVVESKDRERLMQMSHAHTIETGFDTAQAGFDSSPKGDIKSAARRIIVLWFRFWFRLWGLRFEVLGLGFGV